MKTLNLIVTIILITSCGAQIETYSDQQQEQQQESSETVTETVYYDESAPLALRGSVSSAFTIYVDGIQYDDSESYYTDQLGRLEQEKYDEGYEDYQMTFDAEIGLTDLKNGMTVFAEALGDEGYAGETIVVADGTFELNFPNNAEGDYKLRATKRIGVILTNQYETIHWCWNFSATKEITLTRDSKPTILRDFKSYLTRYKCESYKHNQGVSIRQPVSNVVRNDQPPQQAQIDEWDRQWQEEVVGTVEAPTQEQYDEWDRQWQEEVIDYDYGDQNSEDDTNNDNELND